MTSVFLNIYTTRNIRAARVLNSNFDNIFYSQFYYFKYPCCLSPQSHFDDKGLISILTTLNINLTRVFNLSLMTWIFFNIITTTNIRAARVLNKNFDDKCCSQFYYFKYPHYSSSLSKFDDSGFSQY